MDVMVSQITVTLTVCSSACQCYQQKHQSSTMLAPCKGSPPVTGGFSHKGPVVCQVCPCYNTTSTGIDADASKGETSPGYFNSKLVYSYSCGTIFPWEFPEISLAYYHIFMKGPSRSIIYGQIFWHPHPHPHIASPACIYHQNQLSFAFRVSFHLTIHFENAGNICNKIDP